MNRLKQFFAVLLTLALVLFAVPANAVEVTSAPASTVSLSMSVSESITISGTPASITFTYASAGGGTATASGPITVDASWSLAAGHPGGVQIVSWLGSATAALNGPSAIPSSKIFSALNGNAPVACTQTIDPAAGIGVAGAGCGVVGSGPAPAPAGPDGRSNTVVLSMSGLGNLTPGQYSGVWSVEGFIL
jgi:hypothetical protein